MSHQQFPTPTFRHLGPRFIARAVVIALLIAIGPVADVNAQALQIDSSNVELRSAPESKLATYRADARFEYEVIAPDTGASLFDQVLQQLSDFIGRLFAVGLGRPLMWLIIVGILIFAASLLLGSSPRSMFYSNERGSIGPIGTEDLLIRDFTERIDDAIRREDYREAIRLRFARALKNLSDRGLIAWTRDKTNRSYRQELERQAIGTDGSGNHNNARTVAAAFASAANWFDYSWYGHAAVDSTLYAEIDSAFVRLERALVSEPESVRVS